MWEYGYFVTDEGYYLDGGKEKLLYGDFVDLTRTEAFTYGFSPGTHWLAYLALSCFGLSDWAFRIPFILLGGLAWCALYVFVAKKTSPLSALLICGTLSLTPMLLAYERTASNDALIGALAVLAYVAVALGKTWRSIVLAAAIGASIVLVKPSVFVLLPLIAAGVLSRPKLKAWYLDLALFVLGSAGFLFLFRLGVHLSVAGEAAAQGVSAHELIRRTTTHYPLPKLTDIAGLLKGLSAFPRTPSNTMLGPWVIGLVVLPLSLLLKGLREAVAHRRFHPRKFTRDTEHFPQPPIAIVHPVQRIT